MKDNKLKFNNNIIDNKYIKHEYRRQNSKFSKNSSANTIYSKHPTPISSSTDFSKIINKKQRNNKLNPNNINIYNIGINNIYCNNSKLNITHKKDENKKHKNIMGSTDTITLYTKNGQSNISTNPSNTFMNFQRNPLKRPSNISNKNRCNKYKLSNKYQNNIPIYSCKFNLMTYRKDAFGSIIKKNGKQKISFADSPFILKSMNKSRSCPDIKSKKVKFSNDNKNSKNNSDLAEVILIKSYKNLNRMNMYNGRGGNINDDSELVCCSSFCNIF